MLHPGLVASRRQASKPWPRTDGVIAPRSASGAKRMQDGDIVPERFTRRSEGTLRVLFAIRHPSAHRVPLALFLWTATVGWMALMFIMSSVSDPLPPRGKVFDLELNVFKLAHVVEYGVLGYLLSMSLAEARVLRPGWWTMVLVVLFAISDEIHQSFIGGRTPLTSDILLDGIGGGIGRTLWDLSARGHGGRGRRGSTDEPDDHETDY